MITVKDHGELVRGRSVETIARRLYGRRAGSLQEVNVLTPAKGQRHVYNVEAAWWVDVVDLGED